MRECKNQLSGLCTTTPVKRRKQLNRRIETPDMRTLVRQHRIQLAAVPLAPVGGKHDRRRTIPSVTGADTRSDSRISISSVVRPVGRLPRSKRRLIASPTHNRSSNPKATRP
jgi:hypothetical protein